MMMLYTLLAAGTHSSPIMVAVIVRYNTPFPAQHQQSAASSGEREKNWWSEITNDDFPLLNNNIKRGGCCCCCCSYMLLLCVIMKLTRASSPQEFSYRYSLLDARHQQMDKSCSTSWPRVASASS